MNPYEHDDTPDDTIVESCDACHQSFDDQETRVILGTGEDMQQLHASCAALCCGCGEVGIVQHMLRIGAAHWVHYACLASPEVLHEQAQAQQADEARDTFNERRR